MVNLNDVTFIYILEMPNHLFIICNIFETISQFLKYKQMLHHLNLPISIISYYYAIQRCIKWWNDSLPWNYCACVYLHMWYLGMCFK